MKKAFLTIWLCCIASFIVVANDQIKRVAITEVVDSQSNVDPGLKLAVRSSLTTGINLVDNYEAYERVNVAAMFRELDFQRTGYISDDQIHKIGDMTGSSYILIPELARLFDDSKYVLTARIIDVVTGLVTESAETYIEKNLESVQNGARDLALKLLGVSRGGSSSATGIDQSSGASSSESNYTENGTDASLTPEELKSAGLRFLKEYNKVTVINKFDNRKSTIINVGGVGSYLINNPKYFGGRVSKNGLLNGLLLLNAGSTKYLAYVCEGKLAFPLLQVYDYEGLSISLQEGCYSYGYSYGYRNKDGGLCESMSEVYGRDLSDLNILRDIYNETINLNELENAFTEFVRSGKKLRDSWLDDPLYTSLYEGLEPIVEGYKQGDFDETKDQYRPLNDGSLVYSQIPEFYCDGVYDYNEPSHKNGHALHTSSVRLNPNHFRIMFSFKALSNKGWCQGHSDNEQWPLINYNRNLGVRLTNDGNITIKTADSNWKEHYYVTGYNYSVNRYFDIDMEYDHGQFIINGHRFNMSIELDSTQSFHSANYSNGNAFKGYIKGLKIYSYPE